jgi:hypothetical protein
MGSWSCDAVVWVGASHTQNGACVDPEFLSEEPVTAPRRYNILINQDVSKRYASDLDDQELDLIAPPLAIFWRMRGAIKFWVWFL